MNPRDRLMSTGKRWTDPAEALAQQVTERIVDLVVSALDVNELVAQVDVNAIISRVDIDALLGQVDVNDLLRHVDVNALLRQVDVNALLRQVDVNDLAQRVDLAALAEDADIGAIVARSSGGMAREALDAVRCRTAELDQVIGRGVHFLLRRKGPALPPLLPAQAGP